MNTLPTHAKLPQTPIGSVQEVYVNAGGGSKTLWTPTIVNPESNKSATSGIVYARLKFYFHLVLWVWSVISAGLTYSMMTHIPGSAYNTSSTTDPVVDDESTKMIAFIAVWSDVIAVVFILIAAACLKVSTETDPEKREKEEITRFSTDEMRGQMFVFMIQVFSFVGTTSAIYISGVLSRKASGYFGFSLQGTITQVVAQTVLYQCLAAIPDIGLLKFTLPSASIAISLVLMITTLNDIVTPSSYWNDVTVVLVPSLLLAGMVLKMLGERTGPLKEQPFVSALVSLPFTGAVFVSLYIVSVVKSDTAPAHFMFALTSLLLNFVIAVRAFEAPSEEPSKPPSKPE